MTVKISEQMFEQFEILAAKLTHEEYKQITNTMYSLYMGDTCGYDDIDVLGMLRDIKGAQKTLKKKQRERFKVIKGSKFKKD
jgi:hypothetical protein